VERACLQIAIAALESVDPNFGKYKVFSPATDVTMISDLTGKYCKLTYGVRYGPGVAATKSFGQFMMIDQKREPEGYEILNDKQGKPLITTDALPIAGPANCLGTRTTWLGALIANTLTQPCQAPGAPATWGFDTALVPKPIQGQVTLQNRPPQQAGGATLFSNGSQPPL
jgi:hypothetical protein